VIGRFIVDFYCPQAHLCIDVVGSAHYEPAQAEYNAARPAFLEQLGYKVIRFTDDDVRYNINPVIDESIRAVEISTC
jgi:very-short-patch-repair endonuclease